MTKRLAPAIGRGFEGRALMDGAAGSALVVAATAVVLAALTLVKSRVPGGLGALLLLVVLGAIIVAACLRCPPLQSKGPVSREKLSPQQWARLEAELNKARWSTGSLMTSGGRPAGSRR